MSYFTGTATDYLDLTDRIIQAACGYGTYTQFSKSITGDGSYGHNDASANFIDEKIATFPATVTEQWTITCNNATVQGSEVWDVVGSISGALPDATTGVLYTNTFLEFQITASTTTPIAVSDSFVIDTVQGVMKTGGFEWVVDLDEGFTASGTTEDKVKILKGQGTAGTDEIYVVLRPYANVPGDYYNLLVKGITGYTLAPRTFINEGSYKCMPMWNSSMSYWFNINSRRIVVSARVNVTDVSMYAGFMLPYATPTEYPYPLVIAANSDLAYSQYSDENLRMASIAQPRNYSATTYTEAETTMNCLAPGGLWIGISNYYYNGSTLNATLGAALAPTDGGGFGTVGSAYQLTANEDGSRFLHPLVLSSPTYGVLGELEGCFWLSGHGAMVTGNTILVSAQDHMIYQNLYRQEWHDYWCMEI